MSDGAPVSGAHRASLALGETALAQGRYEPAHRACLEVLADSPTPSEAAIAFFLLGLIAAEHRNPAKALELFDRAVALDDAAPRLHAHRARALVTLNRQAEARQAAERAETLAPADALTLDTLGVAFTRLGDHARATPFFRRASALDAANASFAYNLAASLQFIGEFDEAAEAYRRALAIEPQLYKAWSSLVALSKQSATDNALETLERLAAQPSDDADRALHLGHALAKSYEDLGEPAAAFTALQRGKTAKRAALDYDFATDRRIFLAAERTLDGPPRPGFDTDEPIFIIGLPRTGTTLIDRILSSHPQVTSAGELAAFSLAAKRQASTPSNRVLEPETLAAAAGLDFEALGHAYLAATRPLTGATPHFTDKMPLNLFYAGLIHRALPNARIVCLRRHPMDSALANYRQLFATGFAYYNYAFDLADTARYIAAFDRLAGFWRDHLPADRFTEVGYEAMIADQEGETRRLLAFCGLPWDERCLSFQDNTAPVATASSVQVRQPLYASSIGRWRRYGDLLEPMRRVFEEAGIAVED